jgi:FKBP-type peptidyl-prolyl cis-trans isomerase FkpA
MSKAALREKRRAERIAKRRRQRTILGVIVLLVVLLIVFFVWRDYQNKLQANAALTPTPTSTPVSTQSPTGELYSIGVLDTSPPLPSANAITTASGLVYEDLKVGDGATAVNGDTVSVNYTGWLQDGTKFDSSIDRGQTLDFTLGAGKVIAGWDEGVVGMRVNGTRLLVIPPSLGYGSTAYGSIPANSTLIFEVQLVAIK